MHKIHIILSIVAFFKDLNVNLTLIPNIHRGEFGCYLSNRLPFESRNSVFNLTNAVVLCELP